MIGPRRFVDGRRSKANSDCAPRPAWNTCTALAAPGAFTDSLSGTGYAPHHVLFRMILHSVVHLLMVAPMSACIRLVGVGHHVEIHLVLTTVVLAWSPVSSHISGYTRGGCLRMTSSSCAFAPPPPVARRRLSR